MKNLSKKQEEITLRRIWDFHYWSKLSRDANFMPRYQAAMRLYYDQTLDDEGKRILYKRGQSDVSINWLRILLKKMQAYMTANQPQWAAFGVNDDDAKSAHLTNAILGHGWRTSYGYLQVVDLIKKGLVGGVGLWSTYIDYKSDGGLGDVKWKSLPIQFFYPDWRSMDVMYDEMAAQQVAFTVDLVSAMSMIPKELHGRLKQLSTVPDNYDTLFQEGNIVYGQHPDPHEVARVMPLTHYELEERPLWEIKDMVTGDLFFMNEEPNLPLPYSVDIKRKDVPSLVKYDCIYGMGEDDGLIFNIEHIPYNKFLIKPFINEFTENPYGIGEAYFLERLQNYFDKSLRIALQHEQWNANPGVFVPENSVTNIQEFEDKIMQPGFVQEIDMENGAPVFKQGSSGNTGFYNIMNLALDAMRQATGNMFRPEMARGNATEDSLLKSAGQEHGDALFRQFESTLEAGAEAYLVMAKNHYTHPKLLKFIDRKKRPSVLPVNKSFVNEDGELDGYFLSEINTDVVIATRSYAPTEKFLKQRVLIEAMNRAPGEVADLLFLEFLKATEIDPEIVEEAEARLDILPKLMQQMQQMVATIEQLQKENAAMENQLFTADRARIRAGYDAQLETLVKKFKIEMAAVKKIWETKLSSNFEASKRINQIKEGVGNGKEN